jgi:hypothetical protein
MTDVTVTVRPSADLQVVSSRLAAAGMVIEQSLEAIHVVTGKATPEVMSKVATDPDVTDVSETLHIQLPPPNSPVTW